MIRAEYESADSPARPRQVQFDVFALKSRADIQASLGAVLCHPSGSDC